MVSFAKTILLFMLWGLGVHKRGNRPVHNHIKIPAAFYQKRVEKRYLI